MATSLGEYVFAMHGVDIEADPHSEGEASLIRIYHRIAEFPQNKKPLGHLKSSQMPFGYDDVYDGLMWVGRPDSSLNLQIRRSKNYTPAEFIGEITLGVNDVHTSSVAKKTEPGYRYKVGDFNDPNDQSFLIE